MDLNIFGHGIHRFSEGAELNRALKCAREINRILRVFPRTEVHRNIAIPGLSCNPDAVLFITRSTSGCVLLYQCLSDSEPEMNFHDKARRYREHAGMLPFLSELLGFQVPAFGVLGSPTLDIFLRR